MSETELEIYERAKTTVVEALIVFLQAADAIERDGQLALAEVLGAFAAAAESAQKETSGTP